MLRFIRSLGAALALVAAAPVLAAPPAPHTIEVDVTAASQPADRSFNLSVGADYAGTMIRPENLAQLRTSVDAHGIPSRSMSPPQASRPTARSTSRSGPTTPER